MRTPHHGRRPGERRDPYAVSGRFGSGAEAVCNITGRGYGSPRARGRLAEALRYFCAALRSTKVLPPFILLVSGASLIWITTASASTPRFFTSAWVISRIMPAFCSSVRPSAMLTVISGIFLSLGAGHRPLTGAIKQEVDVRDKPGHGDVSEWLAPAHVMARQHLAHFGDEVGLAARELRRAALAPFLVGSD